MEQLKEEIKNFSDELLLNQFIHHQGEYTPEAVAILNAEIKRRNLDIEKTIEQLKKQENSEMIHLDSKDFLQFDHIFTRIDFELASVILRDNKIPFYADNPQSSNTLPLENEAEKPFLIHVHKTAIEQAHELLDEHFEKIDGKYQLKKMSIKEQLKAFSFHELHLSQKEAAEIVKVVLTPEEKEIIIRYGKRVLEEGDRIEQQQDRVIFCYDSIETLFGHFSHDEEQSLTKTDLLTILEILQIFSDDPEFPSLMDESILTLLSFFLS